MRPRLPSLVTDCRLVALRSQNVSLRQSDPNRQSATVCDRWNLNLNGSSRSVWVEAEPTKLCRKKKTANGKKVKQFSNKKKYSSHLLASSFLSPCSSLASSLSPSSSIPFPLLLFSL